MRKKSLGGLLMFLGVTAVAASAPAQRAPTTARPIPTPAPTPTPPPVTPRLILPAVQKLQTAPVTISPDLKAAIAAKPKYDPSLLAQRVTYQGPIPILKVKSGKQYQLEPIGAKVMPPPSLQP